MSKLKRTRRRFEHRTRFLDERVGPITTFLFFKKDKRKSKKNTTFTRKSSGLDENVRSENKREFSRKGSTYGASLRLARARPDGQGGLFKGKQRVYFEHPSSVSNRPDGQRAGFRNIRAPGMFGPNSIVQVRHDPPPKYKAQAVRLDDNTFIIPPDDDVSSYRFLKVNGDGYKVSIPYGRDRKKALKMYKNKTIAWIA